MSGVDYRDSPRRALFDRTRGPIGRSLHQRTTRNAHPLEDWAESFAHYLHILDATSTAVALGVTVGDHRRPDSMATITDIVDAWRPIAQAVNAVSASFGQPRRCTRSFSPRPSSRNSASSMNASSNTPNASGSIPPPCEQAHLTSSRSCRRRRVLMAAAKKKPRSTRWHQADTPYEDLDPSEQTAHEIVVEFGDLEPSVARDHGRRSHRCAARACDQPVSGRRSAITAIRTATRSERSRPLERSSIDCAEPCSISGRDCGERAP